MAGLRSALLYHLEIIMQAREYLIKLYLSWKNDYLSIQTFADHNALTIDQANDLIAIAKSIFNSEHPES